MKPRRLIPVAAALVLAAAAQAGTNRRPAASPFGWLAQLAGHCWQAENPRAAGKVEACWSFDSRMQALHLRTRDANGVTVQSTVRLEHGALLFQTVGRGVVPGQQRWLTSDGYGFDGASSRRGALSCRIVDPRTKAVDPGYWTYRLEPVVHDRYRIVETYQFGGGAQGFSRHVWLFVRAGAHLAPIDDDRGTGCGGA